MIDGKHYDQFTRHSWITIKGNKVKCGHCDRNMPYDEDKKAHVCARCGLELSDALWEVLEKPEYIEFRCGYNMESP